MCGGVSLQNKSVCEDLCLLPGTHAWPCLCVQSSGSGGPWNRVQGWIGLRTAASKPGFLHTGQTAFSVLPFKRSFYSVGKKQSSCKWAGDHLDVTVVIITSLTVAQFI